MSQMSDYLEGELVKHMFRTGSFTKPAALHIGLFSVAPSDAGGGTEITGGVYPRAQLNPADANWSDQTAGNGQTSNLAQINFTSPASNLGQAVAMGIFDAATAGNLLFHKPITPKNLNSGAPAPYFAIGDIVITFSGTGLSNYLKGQLIKHLFRTGSFAKPTVLALALYTAGPTAADTGTEVVGGNYGRAQNNPLDANWAAPSAGNGQTSNVGQVTHPAPSGAWGTISDWGLRDAAAAGNLLFFGAMQPASQPVGATDPAPYWPAASLAISVA